MESLTRAVAFETPPAVAREILQETFEACTLREIAEGVNAFQALLVINIDSHETYLQELAELIHIAHSREFRRGQIITATLARHVSSEVSYRFLELAKADAKEEAKRISFLALLDSLRSLSAVINLPVDKGQFIWMFTEAFMLVKSFVQATHIELIETAIGERQQKSYSGQKYKRRAVCIKMIRTLFKETGTISSGELLKYMSKKYPGGYDLDGVRFTVTTDNQRRKTLAHAAIDEDGRTSGKVIIVRPTTDNYISAARKPE